MTAHDNEPNKILIIDGDSAFKSALEKFMRDGPYEIRFAQTGTNGLKIPREGCLNVGTADFQIQNVNGIAGLEMSNSRKIEAILLVVQTIPDLDLTEEALEFEIIGNLETAGNAERSEETPGGSPDRQDYWKSWLASFLAANYVNPDLHFGDVLHEFAFSHSYGCKLFRRHFGKPFLEKLREIRIAQAVELITKTRKQMKVIAIECGFRSSNRLCEAFKRIHGISPVEYRKRYFKKD